MLTIDARMIDERPNCEKHSDYDKRFQYTNRRMIYGRAFSGITRDDVEKDAAIKTKIDS